MTMEEVDTTPLMEFIDMDSFVGLDIEIINEEKYYRMKFKGKQIKTNCPIRLLYEFQGKESPQEIFIIYKPAQ